MTVVTVSVSVVDIGFFITHIQQAFITKIYSIVKEREEKDSSLVI